MNNYYVYTHTTSKGRVFYVGEGKLDRASSRSHRPQAWIDIVTKNPDFIITIIKDKLTKVQAEIVETQLILKYGRIINNTGTLVNKSIGFGNTGLKYELNKTSLPIYQLDFKGNIIKEFNSAIKIKDLLGYDNSTITRCCNNIYKLSYGYQWCYKKDYTNPKDFVYTNPTIKPIVALIKNKSKFIITNAFNSIKEATEIGFNRDCINRCLNKKRIIHKGLYWKYLSNVSIENQKKIIERYKLWNIKSFNL